MTMLRNISLSFVLLIASVALVEAQSEDYFDEFEKRVDDRAFFFGLSYSNSIPTGGFDDGLDGPVGGFSINAGGRIPETPFYIGLNLSSFYYGFYNSDDYGYNEKFFNGFDRIGVFTRLIPNEDFFRIYLELFCGITYIYTGEDLSLTALFNTLNEEYASYYLSEDVAFYYGPGAGVRIPLIDSREKNFEVAIEIGAGYVIGTKADYIRSGVYYEDQGSYYEDWIHSSTSGLQLSFGLVIMP